jgi:hypothetical protein
MDHLRRELTPARDGLKKKLVGHLDGPTANPDLFAPGDGLRFGFSGRVETFGSFVTIPNPNCGL